MLTIPQLTEKMIAFSAGNTADIHHFLCVWAYAKTIGEAEGLDEKTQFLLEATAIIHDISCPLCREKYGNTDGRYQPEKSFLRTTEYRLSVTFRMRMTIKPLMLILP